MEEAVAGRTEDVNTEDVSTEDKAREQTSAPDMTTTPRRGLRQRGVGRSRAAASAPSPDVNGASLSPQSSGRVLRDRSTRAVPAWLKDAKSEDDNDEDLETDTAVSKRRKVSNGKRKKLSVSAGSKDAGEGLTDDVPRITESKDETNLPDVEVDSSRRLSTQTRAKAASTRAVRPSAQPLCKTEPNTEGPVVESEKKKMTTEIKKKEEEGFDSDDQELDKEPQFQDLTNISTEEDERVSSDEDVPFRDDLNDQSYDPKGERDGLKSKRRLPPRQKDKTEKETDTGSKTDTNIKKEGMESVEEEVKVEEKLIEETGGPRKRGRRKKDDKTPRLPKRRKKPPVQYVRCEMEGCGTVLAHPRYLQHHIKYQHMLKKKYVCPHPSCGRLFRLQKQLLRHAKHHTDQRDYICEYCARAFKSSHNLAVHRMIHTGEKPLQCEICGFTCRQKASLNWHMKKHDADATYQFSCSICGKKFEKKDCVVAHKAKSHPEVLIAEALAANAGALITTPSSLLELQGIPAPAETSSLEVGPMEPDDQDNALIAQVDSMTQQVGHQVVLLGQESLHTMQVPVTIALSPIDPPSPADQPQTHLQLQMPVQFVQATSQPQLTSVTQQPPLQGYSTQQQSTAQPHILQMTFQPVGQLHLQSTSPALVYSPHPPGAAPPTEGFILDTSVMSSSTTNSSSLQPEAVAETVVWEHQETSADVKPGWCTQTENGS